jgi:hypothetical protein
MSTASVNAIVDSIETAISKQQLFHFDHITLFLLKNHIVLFKFVGVFPNLFATWHESRFMHVVILVQKSTTDDASYFEGTKFFRVSDQINKEGFNEMMLLI